MPKPVRIVRKALTKKGFVEDASGDHRIFIFYHDGKKTSINTRISHGEKELRDGLLSIMARQMRLKRCDFDKFVECTLSYEEYTAKMIDGGQLNVPIRGGRN